MLHMARAAAKQLVFTALGSPPPLTRKLRAIREANVLTILRHFCEARLGSVDEVQIRTGQGPSGPGKGSSPF